MKTEKLTYTYNDVFINAEEQPVVVKASRSLESGDEEDMNNDIDNTSDIIVKAPQGSAGDELDYDWLSSTTELTYAGGLLSASGTTYSTNNVEEAFFTYEHGVLYQTVETQTENDGATIRQTRTTDLTYDGEGLLIGIVETVE